MHLEDVLNWRDRKDCGATSLRVCLEAMAHAGFLWHVHQPYYVNPSTRTAVMPWVRLHAVKGYMDMISILSEFPDIRDVCLLLEHLKLTLPEQAPPKIYSPNKDANSKTV